VSLHLFGVWLPHVGRQPSAAAAVHLTQHPLRAQEELTWRRRGELRLAMEYRQRSPQTLAERLPKAVSRGFA